MPSPNEAPGARLRTLWTRLSALPGGIWLFNRMLGSMVPYTGRLGARVVLLEPGHVRVRLKERRAVRNHLGSVHAMALANLGELATGLAVVGALPAGVRGIVTGFEITYAKKARGVLVAECRCEPPAVTGPVDAVVEGLVTDEAGDPVARVAATWRLGPVAGPPASAPR